jgi:hypothetical protein
MPTLHEIQQAFAASLLAGDDAPLAPCVVEDGFAAAERLSIYRNGSRSTLAAALRLTYPAVDRLVGRDFFDAATDRFIVEHPPGGGYLNEYGGEFPALLAAMPSAASLPYLPDVARFEWALSEAANADEAPALDPAALAGVEAGRHHLLRFEPHPSVRLLELRYAADVIADAVLGGDDEAMAAVDLFAGPVRLVVSRGPDGVEARRLAASAHAFLRRMFAGDPLGDILHFAGADAAVLLAEQFARGRLTAFRVAPEPREPA